MREGGRVYKGKLPLHTFFSKVTAYPDDSMTPTTTKSPPTLALACLPGRQTSLRDRRYILSLLSPLSSLPLCIAINTWIWSNPNPKKLKKFQEFCEEEWTNIQMRKRQGQKPNFWLWAPGECLSIGLCHTSQFQIEGKGKGKGEESLLNSQF